MAERVGFEPTVGYKPTPIFKTGAINQLDHLSVYRIYICNINILAFKIIFVNTILYFYSYSIPLLKYKK